MAVGRRRRGAVRVLGLHPDRRASGPRALRRPGHVGQQQRPARQAPAHHARAGRYLLGPRGQPLPRGRGHRGQDPSRDLRDGLPQPVPHHGRRRRHGLPRRLRARRRHRQPEPWPRRLRRVAVDQGPGQLRLAVLPREQHRVQRLRLRDEHVGCEVRLRQPGQHVPEQHRPDRAPAVGPRRGLLLVRRLGRVPAARQRRGRAHGRAGLPLRPGARLGPQVARVLQRHALVLRVGPQLHQGVPAGRGRFAARDQPGALEPAVPLAARPAVRARRRAVPPRVGRRLRP
ncbi:hypothetical protein D3C74_262230 [compost metagenome]